MVEVPIHDIFTDVHKKMDAVDVSINIIYAHIRNNSRAWGLDRTAWRRAANIASAHAYGKARAQAYNNVVLKSAWKHYWDKAWDYSQPLTVTLPPAISSGLTGNTTWSILRNASAALVAWDYSGDYLKMPLDQIHVLASLGDNPAILLEPTMMVMHKKPRKYNNLQRC